MPYSHPMETLMQWNNQGLIPGPDETEEVYRARVHYCLAVREVLPHIDMEDRDYQRELLASAAPLTQPFDLHPDWVPILFSNKGLSPWHGGTAWIFRMGDDEPLAAFFQLRRPFRTAERAFGYERRHLIAHELCHIGRMAFEEPKFEELIAWQTATGWRRTFGPLITSSVESMAFLLSLLFVLAFNLFALFVDSAAERFIPVATALPLLLLAGALVRLAIRQRQFTRCVHNLYTLFGERATAVAFRLTDREILLFAKEDPEMIKDYIGQQTAFRWQFLNTIYQTQQ